MALKSKALKITQPEKKRPSKAVGSVAFYCHDQMTAVTIISKLT